MNYNIPNTFIIGAAKSGTTYLYNLLEHCPNTYASPIKEPNHFGKDISIKGHESSSRHIEKDLTNYLNGDLKRKIFLAEIEEWNEYLKLFKLADDKQVIYEASNTYLYSQVASGEIASKIPDPNIIIMLRNPVKRAYSHYLMDLRMGLVKGSFLDAWKADYYAQDKGWAKTHLYVDIGLYHDQVKRYFDRFPEEKIHVLIFEEFFSNPAMSFKSLARKIGVEYPDNIDQLAILSQNEKTLPRMFWINDIINRTKIRVWAKKFLPLEYLNKIKRLYYSDANIPTMDEESKELLKKIFEPDVRSLEKLIQRDLKKVWGI